MFGHRLIGIALTAGLSSGAVFAGTSDEQQIQRQMAVAATDLAAVARAADQAALEADPDLEFFPNSILVKFADEAPFEIRDAYRQLAGAALIRGYTLVPGLEHIAIGSDVPTALAYFRGLPFVEYAEPDYVQRFAATPNDSYFSLQWGCHNTGQTVNGDPGTADADIDAVEAWDISTGSSSFVVAVIDSGTQWSHPDLDGNIWTNPGETINGLDDDGNGYVDDIRGWDFYSNDNNPDDADGHGTHTAGTVGAEGNNSTGVAGVCWTVKIMPLRFIGPFGGSTSDAIEAMQYLTNKGVKVSNNSWGGGGFSQGLSDAINASKNVGHIFVAAAGNAGTNNDSSPFYPATYSLDNIISVAATDNDDQKASFSNYGATTVDLGAPGVLIASTYRGSQYVYMDGTSMASPHVAGVAALVYIKNPSWTYAQVRSQILSTTRAISALSGRCVTGGVVNAAAALGSGGGNTAPTVSISSPANGASFVQGTSITFTGSANDTQDGNLSGALGWTSSINGTIGSGASFSTSALSVGTHTITASVTDSGGLTGSASISITITSNQSPPNAPGRPSFTNLGGGSGRINWADNSNNESGFRIERQKRVGSSWTNATTVTVGANVTTLTQTPGAGTYRWRVQAYNSAGNSAWSAWRQGTISN